MKIRTRIKYIMLLVTVLLAGIGDSVQASGNPENSECVIRVGYTKDGQMIREEDGSFSGYGVEYLQMLAQYTGWEYEYVPVSEEERIRDLEEGSIDLLCDVSEKEVESRKLLLSDDNCCLYYGMLCAKEDDNTVFFEDYEAIEGKRIALKNRYMEGMLETFAKEHDITYELVYCSDFPEMELALENGEADLILTTNQRDLDGYKYVAKVGVQNQFLAVSEEKQEYMEQINDAGQQIKLRQPFIRAVLYEKYFGRPVEVLTGMTREEYEFIQEGRTIRVVCDANSAPVEYADEETGEYRGIYADALRLIEKESGLHFEFIPLEDYKQAWEILKNGEADMSAGMFINDVLAEQYGISCSDVYIEADYTMIGSINAAPTETPSIAVPQNYIGIQQRVMESYPECQLLLGEDVRDCLKMVEAGEADLTAVNTVFLQTTYNLNQYTDLVIMPIYEMKVPIRCGIGGPDAQILRQILNKTIARIPVESFDRCVWDNAINMAHGTTVGAVLKKITPLLIGIGVVIFVVFFVLLKIRERHFRHLAMTDGVTGLWNGIKFRKEAEEELEHNRQKEYQLISLDIEHFKYVNNDFGEKIGNEILQVIGKRMCQQFGSDALYARDMGDMFLILTEARRNVQELLLQLAEEIVFDNNGVTQRYKPNIKFGICMINQKEQNYKLGEYIDQAIVARKSIKGNAAKEIAVYNQEMEDEIANERRIEKRMEQALKQREFVVYYQPKFQLQSEKIIGAEALVRWMDPEEGLVPPGCFIPVFERNGFILPLDFFVYEEVLKALNRWQKEGKKPIVVSVNVSRTHIGTPDFLQKLIALTDRYQVPRHMLELELTETVLGGKRQDILNFISECKAAGFQISIDDFGSGYSSLNLLKELPVDVLKIDREFLNETEESEKSSIIIEQVVEMATRIQIHTLCEGVETRQQAEFLRRIGCDMAQGYLYSRPVPMHEFEQMLNEQV